MLKQTHFDFIITLVINRIFLWHTVRRLIFYAICINAICEHCVFWYIEGDSTYNKKNKWEKERAVTIKNCINLSYIQICIMYALNLLLVCKNTPHCDNDEMLFLKEKERDKKREREQLVWRRNLTVIKKIRNDRTFVKIFYIFYFKWFLWHIHTSY